MNNREIKILIIDDEPVIRKSLRAFFEDYGFIVTDLESAEEGLMALETNKFDVGIVDLRLPGISGDEFIIKASRINPEVKFVIHTGSVDFNITEGLEEVGLTRDDIILKPLPSLLVLLDKIYELSKSE